MVLKRSLQSPRLLLRVYISSPLSLAVTQSAEQQVNVSHPQCSTCIYPKETTKLSVYACHIAGKYRHTSLSQSANIHVQCPCRTR